MFVTEVFGITAGILSVIAYISYVVSVFQGKTKPSRSTWWILTLVGVLIFTSSRALGGGQNTWIQLSYIVGPLIIAIQSLFPKYGYKTGLNLIDKICFTGAIVCAVLWIIFNSPFIAFLGGIVLDLIGLLPTIKKSYVDPREEDPTAWVIEFVASIVNALGITVWFSLVEKDWIYALYLIIINGAVALLLLRPLLHRHLKIKID